MRSEINANFLLEIIEKHFNYDNGFFIEAGACDGIVQSNTRHLELNKNWKGILVEPNIEEYKLCVNNRPNSKVFNCALVNNNYTESEITMYYKTWSGSHIDHGSVTSTKDSPANKVQGWDGHNWEYSVQTRTLNSILEEVKPETIDFFSLDVEGYEVEVMNGFDIQKYKPKFILLEIHTLIDNVHPIKETLLNMLNEYTCEQLTTHDYFFKHKNI